MPTTDGTSTAPASGAAWDTALSDAMSATGIDPSQPLPDDGNAATTQAAPPASSEGSQSQQASPSAPQAATTGDDGQGTPSQPAASPPATPSVPADAAPEIPDSAPFKYTVNGQEKAVDGAFVLPGDGLYVPEAKIPHFQLMFSRADALEAQNRELYQRVHTDDRLTTWTPPGSDTPVSGRAGLEALHLNRAELLAEVTAYRTLFADPNNIRQVLSADEAGNLMWNDLGAKNFHLQLEYAKAKLAPAMREWFASQGQPQQPVAPAAATSIDVDPVKAVAYAISTAADSSSWKAHLTPDDLKWAEGLLPRYVHAASHADVQANPAFQLGTPILEDAFVDLLRDRATLRASAAKNLQTGTDAGKFNGGMSAGRQAPKAPVPPPRKPSAPTTPPAKKGKMEAWDAVLKEAAEGLAF